MVLFFIADLALTLAFKMGVWCVGKTYNSIAYLVTYTTQPQKPNPTAQEDGSVDCADCVIVTMTRQEYDAYDALNHSRGGVHHASSSPEEDASSSSSSK